jgi:hypothetical protein
MIRERYFHSDPNAPEVALTSARLLLQTDRERRGLRERGLGGQSIWLRNEREAVAGLSPSGGTSRRTSSAGEFLCFDKSS